MKKDVKILFLIIYIFFYSIHFIYPQTEKYKFRHLTTDDGLPVNKSWVVIKDSRGFIWVGTRGGLCRYDGYDVKVFQYESGDTTSLSDNSIIGSSKLIVEDNDGYLWVGTQKGLNKFDPVKENFTRYTNNPEEPGNIRSNYINCLYLDKRDVLWIGTRTGLNKYQPESDDFKVFKPNPSDTLSPENYVATIYEKSQGKFWVGTNAGLFEFEQETGQFDPVPFITNSRDTSFKLHIITIFKDLDGSILFGTQIGFLTYNEDKQILEPSYPFFNSRARLKWLDISIDPFDGGNTLWVTYGKLFMYDKKTGKRTYFLPDADDPNSILGQVIYSIYFDETRMMWVAGTRGVNILNSESDQIKKHPDFADQYGRDAAQFLKDSRNHFWIATSASKLIHFDQDMNPIKQYNSVPVDAETELSSFSVRTLFEDSKGNIWVGTGNKGLYVIEKGNGELVRCKLKRADSGIGPTDIFDIFEDSEGTIWIAANGNLYLRKNHFPLSVIDNFNRESSVNISTTCSIYEDKYGWLWIGTYSQGLFCRPAEFNETDTFLNYNHEPWNNKSLSDETVWAIAEDANGDLWFATENGLNKFIRADKTFERFYSKTEIGANCIWDMTADNRGYLWMVTEDGLIRFNPKVTDSTHHGNYKQMLPFWDIYLKNIDKTPDGRIYIGGADFTGNGYFSFHPDSITENKRIPPVYITAFNVKNEQFGLDTSIILKKHIILKYNQNFFSFKFAALDYTAPEQNQYAWYLEGLEDEWNYSGNRRLANYTGVPPGNYIFRVKGSNNDGYWNEEGASITITIVPPPWKTWGAYVVYGLLVIAVIYSIIHYYLRRQHLLHTLALEQVDAEKLKELDSLKSRFFANISHEFRTPLTLILGPLKKLIFKTKDDDDKQELTLMQRNARRLQELINQLLKLSKLEAGKMSLHTEKQNIVSLVRNYIQSFESLMLQKNISLVFNAGVEEIDVYVDREKIEQILNNLLSNAFKFTEEGGEIVVSVSSPQSTVISRQLAIGSDSTEDYGLKTGDFNDILISVSDTGSGIPPEKLPNIFDRFYQADNSESRSYEGTGIGLALVKELVELHHGRITVESQIKKGTVFKILLPLGKEHLNPEEIIVSRVNETIPAGQQEEESNAVLLEQKQAPNEAGEKENGLPVMLIVEDNPDMRKYIVGYFNNDYLIIEAGNGKEGLERAVEHIPDIIISDVMMPEMDGYVFCEKIKTNERTNHIPLILLTARASKESRLEGLETGADDFIIKPFDGEELQVRVKNLIVQRRKLQERFMKKINKMGLEQIMEMEAENITPMDRKFMQRVTRIIQKYFFNTNFDVEMLSSEMALSRMQVHRKLKAITGYTPGNFIRHIRLNKAAELLKNKTGTVSEIAFDVGFNNLSYFAKCFKEQFGVLPSEFKHDNT